MGSLPICGNDDRLKGMLTDRDIVVKALAQAVQRQAACGAASACVPVAGAPAETPAPSV